MEPVEPPVVTVAPGPAERQTPRKQPVVAGPTADLAPPALPRRNARHLDGLFARVRRTPTAALVRSKRIGLHRFAGRFVGNVRRTDARPDSLRLYNERPQKANSLVRAGASKLTRDRGRRRGSGADSRTTRDYRLRGARGPNRRWDATKINRRPGATGARAIRPVPRRRRIVLPTTRRLGRGKAPCTTERYPIHPNGGAKLSGISKSSARSRSRLAAPLCKPAGSPGWRRPRGVVARRDGQPAAARGRGSMIPFRSLSP